MQPSYSLALPLHRTDVPQERDTTRVYQFRRHEIFFMVLKNVYLNFDSSIDSFWMQNKKNMFFFFKHCTLINMSCDTAQEFMTDKIL